MRINSLPIGYRVDNRELLTDILIEMDEQQQELIFSMSIPQNDTDDILIIEEEDEYPDEPGYILDEDEDSTDNDDWLEDESDW